MINSKDSLRGKTSLWILACIVFPVFVFSGTATLSWDANTESDLSGYQIHYGMNPGVYSVIMDVGNVTGYSISGLSMGSTYYFAVTAYDLSGNLSDYSEEITYTIEDDVPPTLVSAKLADVDRVQLTFSESVNKASAELASNYQINNGIVVQSATLQSDLVTVLLTTSQHANGSYTVTVNNVSDRATVPNIIKINSISVYTWEGSDVDKPKVSWVELTGIDFIRIHFSEPVEATSAKKFSNFVITQPVDVTGSIQITDIALSEDFETVYISTTTHTPSERAYKINISGVKDASLNVMNPVQINYWCRSTNYYAPELVAVRAKSATEVEVEFSEPVSKTTAETKTNYSISNNIVVYSAILSGNNTVKLTTAPHISDNYVLSVKNVEDMESPPKAMVSDQLSYTYAAPDVTPPVVSAVEITSETQVRVEFSEAMDAITANVKSNYTITSGVTINSVFLDNSGKNVYLTTTVHPAGNFTLTARNVKDVSGNVIVSNNSKDYSWAPPDRTPPVLQKVTYQTTQILLQFSEELDRTAAEIESNYAISPSVSITDAILFGDKRDQVVLKTLAHQSGQTYVVTVHNVKDKYYNTIQAGSNTASYIVPQSDNTVPVLVSAQINGKESVQMQFSEPMIQSTVTNISNYTISSGVQVKSVLLDISQQVVFLSTTPHEAGAQYTVAVSGVKDLAGNTIAANQQKNYSLPADDSTPPVLELVEILDDDLLNLVFSKSLDPATAVTASNYQIDHGILIQEAKLSASCVEVRLKTTSHQSGVYHVSVKNLRDQSAAANQMAPVSFEYNYNPSSTDPPVLASVHLTTPYTLELLFDRILDPASAENAAHYCLANGMQVQSAKLDRTGRIVTLTTLEEHVPGSYTVTVNGVKDGLAGIVLNEDVTVPYARLITDKTTPQITEAHLSGAGTLIVSFTEKMDATSASVKSNYKINPSVDIENVYQNSESSVILVTGDHVPGEYTLTINDVKDLSQNPVPAYSQVRYSWNPDDNVAPSLVRVTPQSHDFLEVEFSESVNQADVLNLGNFTISPYIEIKSAILDASNLNKVYLRTNAHESSTYQLTVTNVRDRAFTPNVIGLKNKVTYHFVPPDTIAPVLVSVEARTSKSIRLNFNEPVSREMAENLASYRIMPAVEIREANMYVNLTTIDLETGDHQPGIQYTLEVRQMEDRSPNPNAIKQPLTKTYIYKQPDGEAPKLLSVKIQSNLTGLELIFDEILDQASAENKSNYKIDPSVEIMGASMDGSMKKVHLETTMHMPGMSYQINVQGIRDCASVPNAMSSTWKQYEAVITTTTGDKTAPQVAWIEPVSSTQIDVVFTEPVDKATAENKANYFINESVKIQGAVRDSNMVRVHLTTSSHDTRQAYSIQIVNVKDRATQPNILSATTSVSYILAQGMALSNVNQTNTALCAFENGCKSYTDRDYALTHVPGNLENSLRIITANDDKTNSDLKYLTFDVKGAVKCFVAYDTRIDSIPDWLKSWKATGDHVVDSRENVFALYEKIYSQGRVSLGGNYGTIDDNNYMVFVTSQKASGTLVAKLSKTGYQLAYMSVGQPYYVDREYTIASIPDTLEDCLWLKTANDDKAARDADFLTFELQASSQIYVAYDAKMAATPKWMNEGWEKLDKQIIDSRGTAFDVITKNFTEGDVTLGGNCGGADDNMYLVLLRAVDRDDIYANLPGHFTLGQNYPNPFNPITNIKYIVHKTGHIQLAVYNIMGQQVKMLVDRELNTGEYTEQWDATNETGIPVSSGVYLYRIQQGDFAKTQRMLLVR